MSNIKLRKVLGIWFSLGALVTATLLVGCETTRPLYAPPELDAPADEGLRVGDTVQVDFSSGTDRYIPSHEEQIKGDGNITLPLIGSVQAAGRTTGELQTEIQNAYRKYYVSMTVTVKAPERYYSVGGEVKNPKRDVYVGGTTVIKAIQSAGDFTDFAKKTQVVLTRASGKSFIVNCEKALRNPRLDLPVYPGDTIHVPRRFF